MSDTVEVTYIVNDVSYSELTDAMEVAQIG